MLAALLNVCLLRANPQDLPASLALLALALAAYLATTLFGAVATGLPWMEAVKASAIGTVLLVAVMHTALLLRGLKERVTQTLTALAGCGALLQLLAGAAVGLLGKAAPAWALSLPFEIWTIVVYGHILRHAFSVSFPLGVTLAFVYMILSSLIVLAFLLPVQTG